MYTLVLMVGGAGADACKFHNVFNVQFQTAWDHKSSGPAF